MLATQNEGGCEIVRRLPRKTKVDVRLCHAYHVKRRWMRQVPRLPRKVPQRYRRPTATKRAIQCHKCHACHTKRRWMRNCATPATWNEGGCLQVPRLQRKTKVDVSMCHACHAKCRGVTGDQRRPSAPHSAISTMLATQNEGGCEIVRRLPRKTKVDVRLCHAYHVKRRWMRQMPRLPRKVPQRYRRPTATKRAIQCHKCHKCHACHTKRRWMRNCATPATCKEGGCEIAPRLPHETKVDVTKRHACHVKCRNVTGDQRRRSAPYSVISGTPATQNEGGCEIVPHLPRKTKVDVRLRHACHVKRRWMWDCATPATRNEGGCHQAPRLPRKVPQRHRRPTATKRAT